MDNKDTVKTPYNHTPNAWALFPLVVFLFTYLVVSILAGDFYKMPITVAFSIASVVAIFVSGALSVVSCFSFSGVLQAVKSRPEIRINKVFLIMT